MNYKHGMTKSPEYQAWRNMIARCCDPGCPNFKRYGGRGISVCKRWLFSFSDFFKDVGPRPSPKHSLDRIDNAGNYERGNVQWARRREQQQNLRTNVKLTHNGETS
jgi:hypothetical protein